MGQGWDVLGWLGIDRAGVDPTEDAEVLDSVVAVLDRLEERRARYVAAFAYLLGRVAGADHKVSDEE
jgi:hypothetical protein